MAATITPFVRGTAAERIDPGRAPVNAARAYLGALAPSGRRGMRAALAQAAAWIGSWGADTVDTFDWSALRPADVEEVKRRLLDARRAPATVNKAVAALRGAAYHAWLDGQIEGETLHRIKAVKYAKGRRLPAGRRLEQPELRFLFEARGGASDAMRARDAAMLSMLYHGGLRRSEVAGARFEHYGAGVLRVVGKGNAERRVYLPADRLQAWVDARGAWRGPIIAAVRNGAVTRRPITGQAVAWRLKVLCQAAAVPACSPHDLRRTFVTDLLARGVDLSTVQRLAGHASVTTTTRYDRRGDDAAEAAARLLQSA